MAADQSELLSGEPPGRLVPLGRRPCCGSTQIDVESARIIWKPLIPSPCAKC